VPDSPEKFRTAEAEGRRIVLDANQIPPRRRPRSRNRRTKIEDEDENEDDGMNLLEKLKARFAGREKPEHLRRGELGERAAKRHLRRHGLKFLTANFRSARGEIDLIFRDDDCLVFVEVKTRSSEDWTRPAAAVNARKRRLLSQTALDYLCRLKNPAVKIRFDIVEVLLADGNVREVRHLPNTFAMAKPYRYG
jgi:putative endonuclease